jgi:hypothetical protein
MRTEDETPICPADTRLRAWALGPVRVAEGGIALSLVLFLVGLLAGARVARQAVHLRGEPAESWRFLGIDHAQSFTTGVLPAVC